MKRLRFDYHVLYLVPIDCRPFRLLMKIVIIHAYNPKIYQEYNKQWKTP